jgi:hypothetical protein
MWIRLLAIETFLEGRDRVRARIRGNIEEEGLKAAVLLGNFRICTFVAKLTCAWDSSTFHCNYYLPSMQ